VNGRVKTAAALCLARIEMVCREPERLAEFYKTALGFRQTLEDGHSPVGDDVELVLGQQTITLIGAPPDGRSYPTDVPSWSPLFQHIAIVVADMSRAYTHLASIAGWTPISTSGPQLLPATSGGVTAFKFRDPEGHPLELIAFPRGAVPPRWRREPAMASQDICLGIDHSAISVADTAHSLAFYRGLGLDRSGGSLNVGGEQALLDDVPAPVVEVTALTPAQATPHLELLCYRGDFDRRGPAQSPGDVSASRLVLSVESRAVLDAVCALSPGALLSGPELHENRVYRALLHDPDGHLIWLEASAESLCRSDQSEP
jgi:catechol 2,3-dioxygenase-like lactoylglutathione lyase family enzyme